MKKTLRASLSLFLAFILVFTLCPAMAFGNPEESEQTGSGSYTSPAEGAPSDDITTPPEEDEALAADSIETSPLSLQSNPASLEISDDEAAVLAALMSGRDLGECLSGEILLDRFGRPRFLLGCSSTGYLITHRESFTVTECGEGNSPYTGYDSYEKYYGGFGCYVVGLDGALALLPYETPVEMVPYIAPLEEMLDEQPQVQTRGHNGEAQSFDITPLSQQLSTLAVTGQKRLTYSDSIIRRISFGDNMVAGANACTAVACGIALNALDYKIDNNIVPDDMQAEDLESPGWDNNRYPKTKTLQEFLLNQCGFAPGITGTWGNMVSNGIYRYRALGLSARHQTGISVDWDWTAFIDARAQVKDAIDRDIPSMITTIFSGLEDGDPLHPFNYDQHTMVVYGYRTASDGTPEILVHRGWYDGIYNSHISYEGGVYSAATAWVPLSIASILYRFHFSEGVHTNRNGEKKYYDSNGAVVSKTGWVYSNNNWYYFDPATGAAAAGWRSLGGYWYYLNPADGIMATGWLNVGGKWCYLASSSNFNLNTGPLPTGAMLTGLWRIYESSQAEAYYHFFHSTNGDLLYGYQLNNGWWYYSDPASGRLRSGWVSYNGQWYYHYPPNGQQQWNLDRP